jgi:hypothetical protein
MLPTVTDHKLASPAHPVTGFAAALVVDALRFQDDTPTSLLAGTKYTRRLLTIPSYI